MMTKALQAAASVASDYRGSSVSSASFLPSGAPPSAESLTSTLSFAANELRELVASSASSSITTHYYQNVTKLVRGRLAGYHSCVPAYPSALCKIFFCMTIFQVCFMSFYPLDSDIAGSNYYFHPYLSATLVHHALLVTCCFVAAGS